MKIYINPDLVNAVARGETKKPIGYGYKGEQKYTVWAGTNKETGALKLTKNGEIQINIVARSNRT